jgi:hypothetical protein
MTGVHVSHNGRVGAGAVLTNLVQLGGHVEVGNGAVLGAGVMVHQWVRIGRWAMLGATSGFNRDVLPFAMARGNPARHYRLNAVGLRRRGVTGRRYRALEDALRAVRRATAGRWPRSRRRGPRSPSCATSSPPRAAASLRFVTAGERDGRREVVLTSATVPASSTPGCVRCSRPGGAPSPTPTCRSCWCPASSRRRRGGGRPPLRRRPRDDRARSTPPRRRRPRAGGRRRARRLVLSLGGGRRLRDRARAPARGARLPYAFVPYRARGLRAALRPRRATRRKARLLGAPPTAWRRSATWSPTPCAPRRPVERRARRTSCCWPARATPSRGT